MVAREWRRRSRALTVSGSMRSSSMAFGEMPAKIASNGSISETQIPRSASDDKKRPYSRRVLGEVEGALEGALFGFDLLLQLENSVENGFWTRWATGNVNVNGDDLIAALN